MLNIDHIPNWGVHCIYSLDWTTRITFDPEILTRNGHFAPIGSPLDSHDS